MWNESKNNLFNHSKILVKPKASNNHKYIHSYDKPKATPKPPKRTSIYGITKGDTIEGRNWRETFWFLINRYGQETTVHGLNRICQKRTGFKERIIWSFGFLLALYCLTGLYASISRRYQRKQFKTTVDETNYPVFKIPFPELVICNKNRLNWKRLNESMTLYLAPKHRTKEYEIFFSNLLSRYDTLTVNSMYELQNLNRKYLNDLNYINFTNVIDFMSWRCDEILANCFWRWKSMNCCEIFFPRRTMMGQCLSFNSKVSKGGIKKMRTDSFWPWHYGRYGRESGLRLRVLLNVKSHCPSSSPDKGLMYMVLNQNSYTDYIYASVNAKSVARIAIWGSISIVDEFVRSVSAKDRECVFKDEISSKEYRSLQGFSYEFENCFYAYQQLQMVKYCNCSTDLFFPPGPYPVCKLIDTLCLARNWKNFDYFDENQFSSNNTSNDSDDCLSNCYSLLLYSFLRIEPLQTDKILQVNDSFVDLDFFWRRNYMMTYKTSLVFNWLDLLVSFGGIASLLLGCSLISIVELMVFLFMESPCFVWKRRSSEKRLKELQSKRSIKNLIEYDSRH